MIETFSPEMDTWIGTDESGKGDFFGPLVIAAVLVDHEKAKTLREIGVKDSKRLSDNTVEHLNQLIRPSCIHSLVVIGPERYNQLYERIRNLNRILAWGHARVIENILAKADCHRAVTDQFGDERFVKNALMEKGRELQLEQRPGAEEDVAVAAASIIARAEFIRRLKQISDEIGYQLPKGASAEVERIGKMLVEKEGEEVLKKVAKIHFKTTKAILKAI
jgi:ribonuclease HIII